MGHLWGEPIHFKDSERGVHHIVRGTGHALIFLCDTWRWKQDAVYRDAILTCSTSFERRHDPEDARDAFLGALVNVGLMRCDSAQRLPAASRIRRY